MPASSLCEIPSWSSSRRMPARTARTVSAPHAESSRRSAKHATARSSVNPCLAAYVTVIIWQHNASDNVFAP